MRTTVTIADPLLRSAKRRASEHGVTLSEFLEDALRIHLARKPVSQSAPFHLHTVAGKLVDPGLDLDRTSVLEALDDESGFAELQQK